MEEVVLAYDVSAAGDSRKRFLLTVCKKIKNMQNQGRASIMYYIIHLKLNNRGRDFIIKSLQLVDHEMLSVNYKKIVNTKVLLLYKTVMKLRKNVTQTTFLGRASR